MGKQLEDCLDRGCRLYHHSLIDGVNRFENKVKTVHVGFDPGWRSSMEYEGQRLAAISGTNRLPIRLQLGSLLLQARREQGQGNSSRSNKRQQGPIMR